ncbi:MAG: peptidyl-prolyl cis-trans isomerase [Paracoccaceae bacterium]|nr:peptidyl-prolyl cis-trans isomerase [Paracoccaceae bacterium]
MKQARQPPIRVDGQGREWHNGRSAATNEHDGPQMKPILSLAAALLLLLPAPHAGAQVSTAALAAKLGAPSGKPFSPAFTVNGRIVTQYEFEQRLALMSLLSGPGDHTKEAINSLINDKLQLAEAAKYGIAPNPKAVQDAMDGFAARVNMTSDQFLAALEKGGVDAQSFRDFISAGVVWRDVVQGTLTQGIDISDAAVKDSRALSLAHGAPQVLLSELMLPATPDYIQQTGPLAEQLSQTLKGDKDFSAAAEKYSASASAKVGGKLDWVALSNLPQPVAQAVAGLNIGAVSKPVLLPNAIGLFELRGMKDAAPPPPGQIQVEYLEYLIPGAGTPAARAEIARLNARVTACGGLYAAAKGQPKERLVHETQLLPQVPADVAYELAKLDPNEVSTNLTHGGNTVYLMLCARSVVENPQPTLDEMRNALFGARVAALAEAKLAELRAQAIIQTP